MSITGELPTAAEIAAFSDIDAAACVAAMQTDIARRQAVQLRAVARLYQLRGGDRSVADELAPDLGTSRHGAERLVGLSDELLTRLPSTLSAMDHGEIDTALADRLAGKDPTQIRRVHRFDAAGANERAERRREDRKIELVHEEDAMATVSAYVPAETASAIYSRVDAIARTLRPGEDVTLEQLRADVFTDLLLGTSTGHTAIQGTIFLHIPIGTALGVTEHDCTLEGHGPIPGAIARHIMDNPTSIWRTVFTDPATGAIRDIGRTRRRPPTALAELIRVRDRECRMPACHRPAHHGDLDHARPWRSGGKTSTTNLHSLCRRHNLLKEQPGWRFHHNAATGELAVTTPAGRTHVEKTDDHPPT